ncbi:MAG: hypothetical protein C0592_08585 [Marinilabiliales bacterium]|nr:MAG: hypothetical protein C0592_08585 [Marinilabiliales bacterium]
MDNKIIMKKLIILVFVVLSSLTTVFSQSILDSLVVYYPFDGNANDWSGNGFDATVSGAVLTPDKDGLSNHAYYFDGTDDHIVMPLDPALDPDFPFTVAAWIKPYDYAGEGFRLIASNFRNDGIYSGFWILIDINGVLSMGVGDGGGIGSSSYRSLKATSTMNNNTWYYVVCVFNAFNDFYMYINCEPDTGYYAGTGSSYVIDPTIPTSLGRHNSGYPSHTYGQGIIDEVAIWNRALTSGDVTALCEDQLWEIISVSTNENKLEIMGVFPNPTNNFTTVKFNNPGIDSHQILITSVDGKVVAVFNDVTDSEFSFDCSDYEQGMYFLHVINDITGESVIEKFIVN